jgi:hypothetical protein
MLSHKSGASGEKPAADKPTNERWAAFKDRLAIAGVIVALGVLFFMMIDGAVINFQCSFTDFISFKCNRWDARFKPWDQFK